MKKKNISAHLFTLCHCFALSFVARYVRNEIFIYYFFHVAIWQIYWKRAYDEGRFVTNSTKYFIKWLNVFLAHKSEFNWIFSFFSFQSNQNRLFVRSFSLGNMYFQFYAIPFDFYVWRYALGNNKRKIIVKINKEEGRKPKISFNALRIYWLFLMRLKMIITTKYGGNVVNQ